MTPEQAKLLSTLQGLTEFVTRHAAEPYGLPAHHDLRQAAGDACVSLCAGDPARATTLWKLVERDLGYMPRAAAIALVRAANTSNLVPDATPNLGSW